MRRYWWFVWVKVAVLAVVLLVGYFAVKHRVDTLVSPYVLDTPRETVAETAPEAPDDAVESSNMVDKMMTWVEKKFGVQLDYERLIFDYANGYAKDMIRQSDEERNVNAK